MDCSLDCVLDGLESALALERELGVRSIEIDRRLLVMASATSAPAGGSRPVPPSPPAPRAVAPSAPVPPRPAPPPAAAPRPASPPSGGKAVDLIFLHHRSLSQAGGEMIAKALARLQRPAERSPIVTGLPIPTAKVLVVLGGNALAKFFPSVHGEPGYHQKLSDGRELLVAYSPDYILRFKPPLSSPEKFGELKHSLWSSIKVAFQCLPRVD